MSVFSDCLEKIRERRNLNNTQIAMLCGVEKTVIYRWFAGQRLPNSWKRVEDTIGKLHLSVDERLQLERAYERTRVGGEQYEYYQETIELIARMQREKNEEFKQEYELIESYQLRTLPAFLILENKMEVLQYIQNLCTYLSKQKRKRLYLKMQVAGHEFLTIIKMFCYQNPDCFLEEIVYMDNELDGSYTYNARILQEVVSLLMLRNSVEIYYAETNDSDKKFALNWMISDDFFLQFNDQMSYGMMTTQTEWLSFFQDDFMRIKNFCHPIGHKQVHGKECINHKRYENSMIVGIEFMPCFGKCFSKQILKAHLYDVPNQEKIIQEILRVFMADCAESFGGGCHTFFLPEGLDTFMKLGLLEILPYKMYRPLEPLVRCQLLGSAIMLMERGVVVQHMLREERFPDLRGLHIEQVHGKEEKIIFTIRFQGEIKEQFEITEHRILNRFWQFFEYLKESEYAYSEEETLVYMKKVLKKYQKKYEKG